MPEPEDVVRDVLAGTVWAPHEARTAAEPPALPPVVELTFPETTVVAPIVLEPVAPPEAVPEAVEVDGAPAGDEPNEADPRPTAPRDRRGTALLTALALVVIALGVTSAVLVRAVRRHDAESDRRTAAVTAARQAAVNFTTIDYRTLDRDLARVADGATGDFRREFTTQATSKEFTDRVRTTKVVSTGEVLDAAVTDLSRDRAVVLVIADSTVTNSSLPAPGAVRHVRLRLTMTLVRGHWLVSDLAPAA